MKTVIVTSNNLNSMLSLADFVLEYGSDVPAIVITRRLPGAKNNFLGGCKMLWRSGLRYTFFKGLMNVLLPQFLRLKGLPVTLLDFFHGMGLEPEVIVCDSANDHWVRKKIKSFSPEILFGAGGTHVFNNMLLEIPSRAAINLHPSLLPKYAGVAPYFWCLFYGDKETGGTLHIMAPKLDAGPIIVQRKFSLEKVNSVLEIISRIWKLNNDMLISLYRDPKMLDQAKEQDLRKRVYCYDPTARDVRKCISEKNRFFTRQDINYLVSQVQKIQETLKIIG